MNMKMNVWVSENTGKVLMGVSDSLRSLVHGVVCVFPLNNWKSSRN